LQIKQEYKKYFSATL